MTPEQKLQALFAAETAPSRDYAFEVEVARRIAFRRSCLTVAALAPWMGVLAIALWGINAAVGSTLAALTPAAAPAGMALVLAAALAASMLLLVRRFGPA